MHLGGRTRIINRYDLGGSVETHPGAGQSGRTVSEAFDPYLAWLGIRDQVRPPNHYRLLGLEVFESDADVIATAADRQMAHVRTFQSGPHAQASQRLLNELSAARLCLLKPAAKAAYDRELKARLLAAAPPAAPIVAARPVPVAQRIAAQDDSQASALAVAEDFVTVSGSIGGGGRRHRSASASGRVAGVAVAIGAVGLMTLVAWQSGLFDRLAGEAPQRPGEMAAIVDDQTGADHLRRAALRPNDGGDDEAPPVALEFEHPL